MLTALTALLLAGSGPANGSVFTGCATSQVAGSRTYECKGFQALIRDQEDGPRPDRKRLEMMALAMAGSFQSRVSAPEWQRLRLGGEDAELVRVNAGARQVFVTALPRNEGTRVLTCLAGTLDDCTPALQEMAAAAWQSGPAPGTVAEEEWPLALLGNPVKVPPLCAGKGTRSGGSILCPQRYFAEWYEVDHARAAKETVTAAEDAFARTGQGEVRRDAVPCWFAGIEATCRRVRAGRESGPATLLAAGVEHAGGTAFASCISPGERGDTPPCDVVFELAGESPTLLGKRVALPDGCRHRKASRGGSVECSSAGSASWDAYADVEVARNAQRTVLARFEELEYERTQRACKVQGAETTCTEMRGTTLRGAPMTVVTAIVERDDRAVFVFCYGESVESQACALVFDVR